METGKCYSLPPDPPSPPPHIVGLCDLRPELFQLVLSHLCIDQQSRLAAVCTHLRSEVHQLWTHVLGSKEGTLSHTEAARLALQRSRIMGR